MVHVRYPKCLRIYLTNVSAQAQKFWISLGVRSLSCNQYSTAHTKYSIYQYFPRLAMTQCSNWYEISDMGFSQKTEENPDPPTSQRAYFSKWKCFVYEIIFWNINVSPNYFFEKFVKLHYWDLATTFHKEI